jgi:uncharacterized protein (DUF952 family)
MIYHIATHKDWTQANTIGYYQPAAFTTEGFIHACKAEQIEGVLQRHFKITKGLLVLAIEEKKLLAPHAFVFVQAVNEEFPHIFGNINLDAVEAITELTD